MNSMLKITGSFLVAAILVSWCDKREYQRVTLGERSKIEESYNSLQQSYDSLITQYQAYSNVLPVDLNTSYRQMQRMHQQMEISHQRFLNEVFELNGKAENRETGGITVHMKGHITGAWYMQMEKAHNYIATKHSDLGQHAMADKHQKMAEEYGNIVVMLAELNDTTDPLINKSSILDKGRWDANGCSSCHGDFITK